MKFYNLLSQILFSFILMVAANAYKCCNQCPFGQEKYYSIDRLFNRCGECCMNPNDYWKYKIFEPGLTRAPSNNPCYENGYVEYENTETHGVFQIKMTLDKYRKSNNQKGNFFDFFKNFFKRG